MERFEFKDYGSKMYTQCTVYSVLFLVGFQKGDTIAHQTSLMKRLQAQTLPYSSSPKAEIHLYIKIAIILMSFWN